VEKSLRILKKLHGGAHWERRLGTHEEARDYCTKTETRIAGPWEFGVEPRQGQGRRTDLEALHVALKDGKTEAEISDELFSVWAKYNKCIDRYKRLHSSTNRQWATFTTVLWGPPGTGKTKYVNEKAGPDAYWLKKPGHNQTVFFDDYDGQEDVVIDEFFGWLPRDLMCRMCDRYPLMVDTKGGCVNFYPKRIWITSNLSPPEWWKNVGLGAMERRLEGDLGKVIYCPEDWKPEVPVVYYVPPVPFPPGTPSPPPVMVDEIAYSSEPVKKIAKRSFLGDDFVASDSDEAVPFTQPVYNLPSDFITDAQLPWNSDDERFVGLPDTPPDTSSQMDFSLAALRSMNGGGCLQPYYDELQYP